MGCSRGFQRNRGVRGIAEDLAIQPEQTEIVRFKYVATGECCRLRLHLRHDGVVTSISFRVAGIREGIGITGFNPERKRRR
jgi:hypothetical protein